MDKKDLDLILSQVSNFNMTPENQKSQTKRQYFITYQSHFSIEINAHCLVYIAMLVSEGKFPDTALNVWLQNSQTCESTFRSARAISNIFSAGVNFTVSQFLNRVNKLSVLQNIKSNANQNNLRFPQHHKLHRTTQNTSTVSNTTNLSKTAIENRVLEAYEYAAKLFSPLKIKQLLRYGRIKSIEETSRCISRELEAFWSSDINIINDLTGNSEIESDNEQNDETETNPTDDYNSEEEFELNDNLDMISNTNISTNRGFELAAGIGLGIIVLAIFFRGSICFPIGKHFGLDWLLFLFCLLIDVAIRLGLRLGLCVGIDIALDLLIDVFIADIGTVINLNIRNIDIISDIRVLFRFGIGINIIHAGICFRLGIGFVDIGTAFNDIVLGIVISNRKSIDTGRAIGFGFVYCR
ncbi:unnamed protein product, partial [Rotaria magnacalcarata]